MREAGKMLWAVIIALLISCNIPGKATPTFENCPGFPKSWEFAEFGDASGLSFLTLDDYDNPIVVRAYDEDDKTYLEVIQQVEDELTSSRIELESEPAQIWADHFGGTTHIVVSNAGDESARIEYCATDGNDWGCESTGFKGEARVFVDSEGKPVILAMSSSKLRYLKRRKGEWRSMGTLEFSGPASDWTFSLHDGSLLVTIADNGCSLVWAEFDGSWSERDMKQQLCSPAFATIEFYGFPLIVGKAVANEASSGYALKEVVDEWEVAELGPSIEELFATYAPGCDRAYTIYRRNRNLRRRAIEITPYDIEAGEERGISLPDEYELREIISVAQDSRGRPHMLLLVKDEEGERLLLYAKP